MEIFGEVLHYLIPYVIAGKAVVYVNVGDYRNIWEMIKANLPGMKGITTEHMDNWEDTVALPKKHWKERFQESMASTMRIYLKQYTVRIC